MIRGIHSFNKKLKMKIDVFPRGCFKQKYFDVVMVNGHKFQKLAKATRNSGLLVIVIGPVPDHFMAFYYIMFCSNFFFFFVVYAMSVQY